MQNFSQAVGRKVFPREERNIHARQQKSFSVHIWSSIMQQNRSYKDAEETGESVLCKRAKAACLACAAQQSRGDTVGSHLPELPYDCWQKLQRRKSQREILIQDLISLIIFLLEMRSSGIQDQAF